MKSINLFEKNDSEEMAMEEEKHEK